MRIPRSFRGRLALRIGGTVMLAAIAGSALGYLALRGILYDQLDRSLHRLAEIEAGATADSGDDSVHFHDELFVSVAHGETSPTRYAEVWTLDGRPVAKTRNLEGRDLPLPEDVRERVASANALELFSFEWEGRKYRGLLYPLGLIGSQHAAHLLQVAAPMGPAQAVLANFLRMLAVLVLGGTAAVGVLAWWLAGHAVRPVMEIIRQAESLEMTGSHRRITASAETDELNRLVAVLNSMLARIDAAFENQRSFLADAGHEIKTPLTILRGDVEVALRRRRSPEEYEAVLEQTLTDLRAASTLAEDLITLARSDSGALEPRTSDVSLDRLLAKVAERYAKAAEDVGVRLDSEVEPGLDACGDAALLEHAISNLIDNAIKYGRDGRRVLLSAGFGDDGHVHIAVSDEGSGIPPAERARLFERFYRGEAGRRAARGSGLGLAIVKAIVESHGGQVSLESEIGRGTTVRIRLPAGRSGDRWRVRADEISADVA